MDWILKENIEELKKMVLKEGWLIESLLNQVLNALKERDKEAVLNALKNENEINVMDMKIKEKALIILSTLMPMSKDLRMVTGSFVISSYFQDISEKTLDIARKILELIKEPQLKPLITIPEMTKISLIMLRESMRMFADQNILGAESICEKDAEIDNFFDDIRKELMVYMMEDARYVKRALILLEISQKIEEIADIATKIVETTSYIITGRQYKCFGDKLHTIETLEDMGDKI
ncbi:PhoU family transcriptional regulator [Thermosipho melanesiensis]|uniref:Phosphate uptake regulator, PhoU n=2 Tax=Thermosipho melanesiensis TaxID=46541 RepID=A6LN86_THEM4|nr:PhoU domain-containing protein [Thermosipho melanesiensis]ABR31387.1 phosphate uptake regulator, PhoU [Thermosipho melanesiensis BI429]APT74447.1 PhoU family transcriptional regulator [Thermosipho melanesiensis]OOC36408.1 PhoU family transcriptional regulator [Thermosipho melanesiensis]OOC37226.1 PhoU family transcriptional regulator [Thermosipho melanesiensis]OOC37978.1 PhoU family transcriptional regulator [Thermosipho melanesiensis]